MDTPNHPSATDTHLPSDDLIVHFAGEAVLCPRCRASESLSIWTHEWIRRTVVDLDGDHVAGSDPEYEQTTETLIVCGHCEARWQSEQALLQECRSA